MGAAAPFFAKIGAAIFTKGAFAVVIKTILINVALGSLRYRDENGELWSAVDG